MSQLNFYEKKSISSWLKLRPKYKLIYSARQDEPTAAAFHKKCDGNEKLLTVAYNSDGYCFGGYFSIKCASNGDWVPDSEAFVFQLREANNKPAPRKFESNGKASVYMNATYGPALGADEKFALITLNGSPDYKGRDFASGGKIEACSALGIQDGDDVKIAGGNYQLVDLEVYQLTETPLLDLNSPWRNVPYTTWNEENHREWKDKIIEWEPMFPDVVPMPRIMLIGPIGVGKSSFINTIKSIFYGYPTIQASVGKKATSLTSMFRYYTFRSGRRGKTLPFQICDTMGLEDGRGLIDDDMHYILQGCVPDMCKLKEGARISPMTVEKFIEKPSLDQSICVAVIVVTGESLDTGTKDLIEKIKKIRDAINDKGVPLMVLLTKIDDLCTHVQEDITDVFHSTLIAAKIDEISEKLGVPRQIIMPVKNYEQETEVDFRLNILSLMALYRMLQMTDDYFDEQFDLGNINPGKN